MEDYEAIELIQSYADDHPSFDTDFIESIAEAYEEHGQLTDSQYDACMNIIRRFRMLQWEKAKDNVVTPGKESWDDK